MPTAAAAGSAVASDVEVKSRKYAQAVAIRLAVGRFRSSSADCVRSLKMAVYAGTATLSRCLVADLPGTAGSVETSQIVRSALFPLLMIRLRRPRRANVARMTPADKLLAFAALTQAVVAIPGPSVPFVVGRALPHSRRVALASVAGVLIERAQPAAA